MHNTLWDHWLLSATAPPAPHFQSSFSCRATEPTFVKLSSWNTLEVGNDAASNACINMSASNTCIQLVCIYGCIIAETWNTLDVEINWASNTGQHLSVSNTFIQFCCTYACIPFCFYITIVHTGNPLITGNNAASNACKFFWLHPILLYSLQQKLANILNVIQKAKKCNNTHLATKNYVNFVIKLDAEISIWMQSRFDGFYFSATLIATVLCRARSKRVIDGNTDIYILVWLLGRHFMFFLIIMWDHWLWLSNASSPRSQSPGPTVTIVEKGIEFLFSSIDHQKK